MGDGNGFTMSAAYDSRLQLSQVEVDRAAQNGSTPVMKSHFDYYADASIKYGHDLMDERFDRAYRYDHVALLKEAFTGSEARDFLNGTYGTPATGPYWQSYQHDAFGNMTHRDNRFWSQLDGFTATYANNRRQGPGIAYDAEGNLTQDPDLRYAYDAAGNNATIFSPANSRTIAVSYDGDEQMVKRSETQPSYGKVTYYVRSSVLGGLVVTELNQQGQKQKGYVFGGGETLAEQQANLVKWRHENPVTGSRGSSFSDGSYAPEYEPDSMGVHVGFEDPYLNPGGGSVGPEFPMLINSGGTFDGGCTLDGMAVDCSWVMQLMSIGAAAQCPNNDCGPHWNPNRDGLGRSGWEILYLFDAGFSYQPLGPSTRPPGITRPTLKPPTAQTPAERQRRKEESRRQRAGIGGLGNNEGHDHLSESLIPVGFLFPQKAGQEFAHSRTPYVDQQVLSDCVDMLFGVTMTSFNPTERGRAGSFTGIGLDVIKHAGNRATYTIYNDVTRYSSEALTSGNANKNERVTGLSDPAYPWTNYTANNLSSMMEVLRTQVHELGHSLDVITGYRYKDKLDEGSGFRLGQTKGKPIEAGFKLEGCVAKYGGFRYR